MKKLVLTAYVLVVVSCAPEFLLKEQSRLKGEIHLLEERYNNSLSLSISDRETLRLELERTRTVLDDVQDKIKLERAISATGIGETAVKALQPLAPLLVPLGGGFIGQLLNGLAASLAALRKSLIEKRNESGKVA